MMGRVVQACLAGAKKMLAWLFAASSPMLNPAYQLRRKGAAKEADQHRLSRK